MADESLLSYKSAKVWAYGTPCLPRSVPPALVLSGLRSRWGRTIFQGMKFASWRIKDGLPERLKPDSVGLERDFEDWIVREPSLIDYDLSIVGRQCQLEGGRLRPDLIAQNAAGALVVIEIKATRIYRETVAQALDYAAKIREMPTDELVQVLTRSAVEEGSSHEIKVDEAPRDVEIVLVGIGDDRGAARVSEYLQAFDIPIRSVAFEVISVDGQLVLLREEDEELSAVRTSASGNRTVDEILLQVSAEADRDLVSRFLGMAERLGLVLRPYKKTIMIAPPQNKARFLMLVTISDGRPWLYTHAEPFIEFFEFNEQRARTLLDKFRRTDAYAGEIELTDEVLAELEKALSELFGSQGDGVQVG